jgi:hypothetical protein
MEGAAEGRKALPAIFRNFTSRQSSPILEGEEEKHPKL